GRDDDRQGVRGQQALEIAALDEAVRGPALRRGPIVRVDPDEGTILHGSHPFLEMVSAKSVPCTPTPPRRAHRNDQGRMGRRHPWTGRSSRHGSGISPVSTYPPGISRSAGEPLRGSSLL